MIPKETLSMEGSILEAAERLFLERGFAHTSTSDIAREAGCNQALIHYYFRTKEGLFSRIFEAKVKLFSSAFLHSCEQGGSFEEKLTRKIEAHFDILMQHPKLPFLILNEIYTNPQRIRMIQEKLDLLPFEIIQHLEQELQEEIAHGRIRPYTAYDLMLTMLSLNITLFLFRPVVAQVFNLSPKALQSLMLHRRAEHVQIILRSLRP